MSNNYLEIRKYRINTLSPIHIQGNDGSGEYGQSYIKWSKDRDFIYLVDTLKLQHYLYENHGGLKVITDIANWINNHSNEQGITSFLKKIGFDFDKTPCVSKGKVYSGSGGKFIRNAFNNAYVPGSSIKGVIRTAVLWKILDAIDENELTTKLVAFIERQMNIFSHEHDKNKFKENFFKDITKDIFQSHELNSERITKAQSDKLDTYLLSPFSDFFRAIKIKDSSDITKSFLYKKDWKVLSSNREKIPCFKDFVKKKEFFFDPEQLSLIDFEISLDTNLLQSFNNKSTSHSQYFPEVERPFNSLDELMSIVFEFSENVWNELSKFYTQLNTHSKSSNPILYETGCIKKYFKNKGFGFIKSDKHGDLFFHINNVQSSDKEKIKERLTVSFNVVQGRRNIEASDISLCFSTEINHLLSFYQNYKCPHMMKIGWGTGLNGTTIALILKKNSALRSQLISLRDDVISQDKVDKKTGRKPKHGPFVPKSTRVVCNELGEPEFPIGWITLNEI